MKLQYKLGIMALGLIAFTSCEKNDPFADHLEIGQRVPTCYWEVGSTTCKAGEYFLFKGQYYTEDGHTPSHSEVWYNVTRTDEASATAKIAGPGFSITKSYLVNDTVRTDLPAGRFDHSLAVWDEYQFVLIDSVQVSETLSPVAWNFPVDWKSEEKNFNAYFAPDFAEDFEKNVDTLILKDSYYGSLRYLYINRKFDTKLFDSLTGLNTTEDIQNHKDYDANDENSLVTVKSALWYDYDNMGGKTAKVVRYYYTVIDEKGKEKYIEVKEDEVYEQNGAYILHADSTTRTYAVYDSAPWVFSRFDDDLGAVVSSVREEYIPAFSEALVKPITFDEWIYSNSDKNHSIMFNRKYLLNAKFKVYDTEGNIGVAHTTYPININ